MPGISESTGDANAGATRSRTSMPKSEESSEMAKADVSHTVYTSASRQAERAGFEPAVRFDPHTAFPVPHLRPLGHLSEWITRCPDWACERSSLALFGSLPSRNTGSS